MAGYLTSDAIEQSLAVLANNYPQLVTLLPLPETSTQGRTSHAIKIAHGAGGNRHGVLFLGGVHARELVNPDLLVKFALQLCQAYTTNTGLAYGPKSYSSVQVKLIVDVLDTIIFPLVNPDGRAYVQDPAGDAWWRKNRGAHPGTSCLGVDVNRNFDFLWSSGIGTSTDPCEYQIYRGPSAFSEPETRNVRSLLETFPNVDCMIDIHSYSEDFLYPWGDDENQSTTPTMNFRNPAYNGTRGTIGDTAYREFIPQPDWDWFVRTAQRTTDAITAVRGRTYTPKESTGLYPTSGTSDDYAYSRHFVDTGKRRVYAFCLETGQEFQPAYDEALAIINEVSAGLVEFLLSSICVVDEVAIASGLDRRMAEFQAVRARLAKSKVGRAWIDSLERNTPALVGVLSANDQLRGEAAKVLSDTTDAVGPGAKRGSVISKDLAARVDALAQKLSAADETLSKDLQSFRRDIKHLVGHSLAAGLKELDRAPAKTPSPSP